MRQIVVDTIEQALAALIASGALSDAARPAFGVEPPKQAAHGDLSCNVALVSSKALGKPPRVIAQLVADWLTAHVIEKGGVITKVEIAGPGFLNLTVHDRVLAATLREVLVRGDHYGRAAAKSGKKVNVEFVSANPTGPVHIGHARGTFVGDAIARVLEAAGHDVTREFYINDAGGQVLTLGRTVFKRYRQLFGEDVTLAEGEYPAEYVVDIARGVRDRDGDRWLALKDDEAAWLPHFVQAGIAFNLAGIKATLQKAKVEHDVFTSEATLHAAGKVTGVVDFYRSKGVTYEADKARDTEGSVRRDDSKAAHYGDKQLGGTFLTTSAHGDDEDRIILRADGTPVYLTADLAYHKDKFDRGFDEAIDVFGADHAGHVPRMRAGVRLMGVDDARMSFVLVQMVRIVRDGQEVKVSKRKGTVFELSDLLDEAGADPCRFIFLSKTPTSQFDFDLALVQKQSSDNPVFTYQYGHARCATILKKAADQGVPFLGVDALTDAQLALLTLPEERAMLKKMASYGDVIQGAAQAKEPHRVLYFCGELISEFHSYFSKYKHTERVLSDDKDKSQARLGLVAAVKQCLKSAFTLLGVSAPDHMAFQERADADDEEATP